MACTMTAPSEAVTTPISSKFAGSIWADEHQEPLVEFLHEQGMIEGMEDVVFAAAVLTTTVGDNRVAMHHYKLPCIATLHKLPW